MSKILEWQERNDARPSNKSFYAFTDALAEIEELRARLGAAHLLSTEEILSLERRSNMTNDEALRYAQSVESAVMRKFDAAQPASAEPVAYAYYCRDEAEICHTRMPILSVIDEMPDAQKARGWYVVPLFTAPQPAQADAQDARDAARYEYLRNAKSIPGSWPMLTGSALDAAIDAAMEKP